VTTGGLRAQQNGGHTRSTVFGVGVSGGAEAAIHATHRYINSMSDSDVIVKLDFANAFNTPRGDYLLEAMSRDVPELYRFSFAAYSAPPILQY